ncbi:hypothetical protein [Azospirillum argentinense]
MPGPSGSGTRQPAARSGLLQHGERSKSGDPLERLLSVVDFEASFPRRMVLPHFAWKG